MQLLYEIPLYMCATYYLYMWVPSGLRLAEHMKPQLFIEHLPYAVGGKGFAASASEETSSLVAPSPLSRA